MIELNYEQGVVFDVLWNRGDTLTSMQAALTEMGASLTDRSIPAIAARRELPARGFGGSPKISVTKPKPKEYPIVRRLCLMHGKMFDSRHPGERVCPSCKGTDTWRLGTTVYGG